MFHLTSKESTRNDFISPDEILKRPSRHHSAYTFAYSSYTYSAGKRKFVLVYKMTRLWFLSLVLPIVMATCYWHINKEDVFLCAVLIGPILLRGEIYDTDKWCSWGLPRTCVHLSSCEIWNVLSTAKKILFLLLPL